MQQCYTSVQQIAMGKCMILNDLPWQYSDLGVKMEINPGVIKERFYVTTSMSDSWGAFTPAQTEVTLGKFLH